MNKIRGLFEVENFVASTRRWYRQGKPERCRRTPRLPNTNRWGTVPMPFPVPVFRQNESCCAIVQSNDTAAFFVDYAAAEVTPGLMVWVRR